MIDEKVWKMGEMGREGGGGDELFADLFEVPGEHLRHAIANLVGIEMKISTRNLITTTSLCNTAFTMV